MNEPIEEVYFNWLYAKVARVQNPTPSLTYYTLLRELHSTEFVWLVPGDDNRAEDGVGVRREFYHYLHTKIDDEQPWFYLDCSVLEMLIAFSRRAAFQTDISDRDWFWRFLENLGLSELYDSRNDTQQIASEVINTFVWRLYDRKGNGGLFPLSHTNNDQRRVEVWYQFCEYLVDQGL